jgi:hypothetical protein
MKTFNQMMEEVSKLKEIPAIKKSEQAEKSTTREVIPGLDTKIKNADGVVNTIAEATDKPESPAVDGEDMYVATKINSSRVLKSATTKDEIDAAVDNR